MNKKKIIKKFVDKTNEIYWTAYINGRKSILNNLEEIIRDGVEDGCTGCKLSVLMDFIEMHREVSDNLIKEKLK